MTLCEHIQGILFIKNEYSHAGVYQGKINFSAFSGKVDF
jgi:hypothetical protein